jgi:lipid-A-disaccharide synthase-like uncharacterized protein
MKWEVFLAMAALMFLGFWLVAGDRPPVAEGSTLYRLQAGPVKGHWEARTDAGVPRFRALPRTGEPGAWVTAPELDAMIPGASATFAGASNNFVFRMFNVTSWASMAWVAVGLGGQIAFFGRMAVQWVVSERQRQSVVPPVFWYLSLGGGIALFAYFVWRQDLVGVLGQTSGIVIYGRNIRLLAKQRRRDARKAAKHAAAASPPA